MRPIALKGHERPITFLTYNREGDLLFTCSKDGRAALWYADTGERVGTYKGHTGAVWSLDVNWDSTHLLTGSGDSSAKIWDVERGVELFSFRHKTPVKSVAFGEGDTLFLTVTDASFNNVPSVLVWPHARDHRDQSDTPLREISQPSQPYYLTNQALFGPLNTTILTANNDGTIRVFDTETGKQVSVVQEHKKGVNSLSFSADQGYFISASDDHTAKLFDTKTLKVLKVYEAEKAVNAAAISPNMPHVILGGGQDAADVTTTHSRVGNFQTRFFHKIYQNELASVKGHFGPIHVLAFSPDGKSFASGAEDGYARIHHFDSSYFELDDLPAAKQTKPQKQ